MNHEEAMKEFRTGIAWGGSVLFLALCAALAHKLGYISSDAVMRWVCGANGLMIAWYGNRIPKKVVRTAQARQATRVAGWSMLLSGLIYTGLWAFASMSVAITFGSAAVFAGIIATFGYCLSLRSRAVS
jgi:hypothetical protein